jgi:hypothetical protein
VGLFDRAHSRIAPGWLLRFIVKLALGLDLANITLGFIVPNLANISPN